MGYVLILKGNCNLQQSYVFLRNKNKIKNFIKN